MTNSITNDLQSDTAILRELGERLGGYRLRLSLTQAQLAEQAGISKRTVERIEAGHSAQLSSLVRILRVLELLSGLEQLVPESGGSPMALLQRQGRERQRASGAREKTAQPGRWSWGDEA